MNLVTNHLLETESHLWQRLAYLSILLHFIFILVLSLFRHWGFMTTLNDLGIWDQVVWGLANGESFLNTTVFNYKANWLGIHFTPILALLAPLYAIFPSVVWLFLVQAGCLSLSGIVLFFFARRVFNSDRLGFIWMLAYLLNPTILNAGIYDFSPMTITLPCILTGILAIELRRPFLLSVAVFVILLCKEHLGVMSIGFGILWWIKTRKWKTAVFLIALGVTHALVVMGVIMPALSPTKTHIMLSEDMGQLSRYSWLGNSLTAIIKTIFTQPLFVFKTAMLDFGGIQYLGLLLMFFLGLPLVAAEFMLPAIADLGVNLLSFNSLPRSIYAYHNLSVITVLTVAAIYGAKKVAGLPAKLNRFSGLQLATLVLGANLIGGYFLGPLPLPGARNIMAPTALVNWPDANIPRIRAIVGDNASVSVQANIGAYFSQRKEVFLYPNQTGQADAIILRLESPTRNVNNIPEHLLKERRYLCTAIDGHLQMDRTDYLASIETLLSGREYGIVFWKDPWLVFRKGAVNDDLRDTIGKKVAELKIQWKSIPIIKNSP